MTNYKKVSKLSQVDAAYIAGFIDADGSITLSRRHKNENRQLVVSISNTEPSPLKETLINIHLLRLSAIPKIKTGYCRVGHSISK